MCGAFGTPLKITRLRPSGPPVMEPLEALVWALTGTGVMLSEALVRGPQRCRCGPSEAPVRVLTVALVGSLRHCSVGSSQSDVGPLELLARTLYKPTGALRDRQGAHKRSAVSSGALWSPRDQQGTLRRRWGPSESSVWGPQKSPVSGRPMRRSRLRPSEAKALTPQSRRYMALKGPSHLQKVYELA